MLTVTIKKLWCESQSLSADSDSPRQTEVDCSLFEVIIEQGHLGANWKYSNWDTLEPEGHWFNPHAASVMRLGKVTTVRVPFDSTAAAQQPAGDTAVQMTFLNK